MALVQRFTNTGILQTAGNIVEDSLNIEPTVVTSTSNTPHAIAAYPTTITGTGLTNTGTGTFNWTCPAGVTSVCVVAVGGGGKGGGGGGGGGGLGWKNNITVVPGTVYTVVTGAPGTTSANGGDSYFISTATVKGGGGSTATTTLGTGNTSGGTYTGDGGGNGGSGSDITTWGGGGGGAGGYTGAGGAGGNGTGTSFPSSTGSNGTGGGGGGGSAHSTADSGDNKRKGGGGGGVGLFGQGSNGAGAISSNFGGDPGGGGSGGSNGVQGNQANGGAGGAYGGGGGGSNDPSGGFSDPPGVGAVRIIWGTDRSFPTNSEFLNGITNHTPTRLFQNGNFFITGEFDEYTLPATYPNLYTYTDGAEYSVRINPSAGTIVTYIQTSGGNGAVFNARSNNWTIEFWFKTSTYSTGGNGQTLLDMYNGSTWAFMIYFDNGGSTLQFYDGTNNQTGSLNSAYTLNQWNHFALVCNTTLKLFINGVVQSGWNGVTNNIVSNAQTTNITQFQIAGGYLGVSSADMYYSQYRVNNTTSVYTGNFTPPSRLSATQSSGTNINAINGGTILLTCNSPSFVDQSTNAFTLTPYYNPGGGGGAVIPTVYSTAPTFSVDNIYNPPGGKTTIPGGAIRRQTSSSYQVYNSFDEVSLAYTITPDKTLVNEGDTVTYTVNAPILPSALTTASNNNNSTKQAIASYPTTITGTGLTNTGTGTFNWTCPAGVTSVSVVCVGGGGGGEYTPTNSPTIGSSSGGGGGGLAYLNNISVIPGNTYSVVIGAGGTGGTISVSGSAGGSSYFINSSTIQSTGGSPGQRRSATGIVAGGAGGTYSGTGVLGGSGGSGGYTISQSAGGPGGGGGAGGYAGNGGNGGYNVEPWTTVTATSGAGGGAAGGAGGSNGAAAVPGGGVGLLGQGTSGTAISFQAAINGGQIGGSGGTTTPWGGGVVIPGGSYGGGGHGGQPSSGGGNGGSGGPGAVAIIWGTNSDNSTRAYPLATTTSSSIYWTNAGSTAAADFSSGLVYGVTPLTWAGTATATLWSFTGITQLSTSGFGTGAVFSIRKNNATTTMGTHGVLTVIPTSPGSGYTVGDTIVINGASLGLTTTTNNLTITVGSDWFAQVIYSATITGTGMVTAGAGIASWTCPDGVYRISVAAVGGGGGGGSGAGAGGGGGGGSGYITDIAVTPGSVYTVVVGVGGAAATQGGTSYFNDPVAGILLNCNGGDGGFPGGSVYGGTVTVGSGFAGGDGGWGSASPAAQGGGGGAGGLTANGGNGGSAFGIFANLSTQAGKNSASGGGGGSCGGGAGILNSVGTQVNTSTGNGGGGGGVLLAGVSNLGVGGVNLAGSTGAIIGQSGIGGSGGATGGAASATVGGAGGALGGGGGGGSTTGGVGGAGAVRIIWNYPHGVLPSTTALTAVTNTRLLTAQAAMVSLNATDTTGINTIKNYGGTITSVASPIPFAGTFSNGGFATASYLTVYLPPKTWNPSTDTTWTLEGWLYMTTAGAFCLVSGQTAGTTVFYIQWGGSGVAVSDGTNQPLYYANPSLVINTWYHIAVVNNGGNLSLYFNGVLRASGANTLASNAIDTLVLGRNLASVPYFLTGNLSNFRLVKGTAVYSGASFTVPTAALTAITNTLVLTCQSSTTVIDNSSSPSQVTSTGSTTAVTATIPFASTYSYQFNGTSQYLTIPSSSNFVYGATDDFTIEGYLYTSATTINKGLIYKRSGAGISGVNFGTSTTTASRFTLKVANASGSAWTINDETAGTFAVNIWIHFAITKTNGVIYLYLNGLLTRQYAHTTAIYDDGSVLTIGRDPGGSFWVGFISNLRIINGTALYYPPSTIVNRNYPDYPYVVQNSGVIGIVDSSYTTPGTYSWTCPQGVTSINAICVGGGGSGGAYDAGGGGGGGLGYKNNITVIPGTTYTIVVGAGGVENITGSVNSGGDSYFISTSTVKGGGGGGGLSSATPSTGGGAGGTYVGDGGGNGGAGGAHVNANMCGAGGGAGGYAGTGGAGADGSYQVASAGGAAVTGSGGAGGGSNGIDEFFGFAYAAGGGGVGILGKGVDGLGGAADPGPYLSTGQGGIGGSGGTNGGIATGSLSSYGGTGSGRGGTGGNYGGGGGGGVSGGGAGGSGAVRIYTTSPRTLSLIVGQDILQEGVQDIKLELRSGSTSGTILATAPTVVVADTSRPLALPGGGQCWCTYPDYVSGPNLVYTGTPGQFTFTAPKGYTTVSVVCIGGGGAGGYNGGGGGGGGALAYIASTAVTAGTTYAVVCGAGGTTNGGTSDAGSASSFNSSIVIANGGQPGGGAGSAGGTGGTVGAGTGFAGGAGGAVSAGGGTYAAAGGGGAGGYTAVGGVGGAITGTWPTLTAASGAASATGGAGGGAGGSATAGAYYAVGGGGGGTSPFGSVAVASLAGIAYAGASSSCGRGGGGSGGNPTTTAFGVQLGEKGYTSPPYPDGANQPPHGGRFGGGGGGGDGNSQIGGNGGHGCVRIIWGTGRAYPSTLTADRVSGYPAAVGNPAGQQ